MATCPAGHESGTIDYCDQCGRPIEVAAFDAHEPDPSSVTQVKRVQPLGEPCPVCRRPRREDDRYCENDGYDFEEATPVESLWRVTVSTDRARFDALRPEDLAFPVDAAAFTVLLDAESVTVGRRSPARGIEPDIDLGGRYDDPGVSRRHLRFDRTAGGSYAVVDCGSANGTSVNSDPARILPDTPVTLEHGDHIHLGAWTTITIERQTGGASAT
jgi:FHA domain